MRWIPALGCSAKPLGGENWHELAPRPAVTFPHARARPLTAPMQARMLRAPVYAPPNGPLVRDDLLCRQLASVLQSAGAAALEVPATEFFMNTTVRNTAAAAHIVGPALPLPSDRVCRGSQQRAGGERVARRAPRAQRARRAQHLLQSHRA